MSTKRKIAGISFIIAGLAMLAFGAYGVFLGVVGGGVFIGCGGLILVSIGRGCLSGEKTQDLIDDLTRFMPL